MVRPRSRNGAAKPAVVIVLMVLMGLVLAWWRVTDGGRRPVPVLPAHAPAPVAPSAPVAETTTDRVVLTPDVRAVPGVVPTARLRYAHPGARQVSVSGSWDFWAEPVPMTRRGDLWELDVRELNLTVGRYEFKFIADKKWESGENRIFYMNMDGLMERPDGLILAARVETPHRIDVLFRHPLQARTEVAAQLVPPVPLASLRWREPGNAVRTTGYSIAGEFATFYMDERLYELKLRPTDRVVVAGTFNNWRTDGSGGMWALKDEDGDGLWTGTVRLDGLAVPPGGDLPEFKFVVNDRQWLRPPGHAPNAADDGRGNVNLRIDPDISASRVLEIHTESPLDPARRHVLVLEGLGPRPSMRELSPGRWMDDLLSSQPLGVIPDRAAGTTTFRLFAPRASAVEVHLYDGPAFQGPKGILPPSDILPMRRDADGTWDVMVPEALFGRYYVYRVDGPQGAGEGFNPHTRVADPYAVAVAHSHNNAIILDREATNRWFTGWTNHEHRTPALADAVIYEAHIRDLTSDASSGVPARWRGSYAGLLATLGTGTGLDHIKALGVNVIELLPPAEFWNGEDRYDWGYGPAFFFAPEASYAQEPLAGSQYYEFKTLVNELHRQGFAVLLDMVYNHMGEDNPFYKIDRKYYFRQDQDYRLHNFSGCGNDLRTEAPMMRRLIVENVLYWMREHRVDGFRFDLADLIDLKTLMDIRDAARAVNPQVMLISEPWSFRGDHRAQLRGEEGWSAWNGDFRYGVWRFVRGEGNRDDLPALVRGSVDSWAATPAQAVNYLESHDDKTFADEVTTDPRGDGRHLSAIDGARNRLGATILFTSLGVPMIAQGQEWIRSKHGIHNTYDQGDAVNALRWNERERPEAARTMAFYRDLIRLRRSPAAAALRWDQAVPDDYFTWVRPADGRALGYIVNGARRYPGAGFIVLLNAADRDVEFDVPFPPGQWRLISNGQRMEAQGMPWQPVREGSDGRRTVRVPPVSGFILIGM